MAAMSEKRPQKSSGGISSQQGFSLIELLVAILLLMIGFMAVFTVLWSSTRAGSFSRNMTTAASLGQDMLERAHGLSDSSLPATAGFVNYTAASISAVGFTREMEIINNYPEAGVKTINARITWNTPGKGTSTRTFTMTRHPDY
jgi:type IV pilus assembly protein PilV